MLQALAAADGSLGVSALGRKTGLAKSTVSRILATLDRLGMVERIGADGRYRLGPGLAVFTPRVDASLLALARPHLRELVDDTGEDAGLAVSDGTDVLYVDQVPGAGAVHVQDWTGTRPPPHTVAAGIVLMRSWATDELDRYLSQPLEPLTPGIDADPTELRRRVGAWDDFVWTHHEFAADVNGAAAPVRAPDGSIVAAVHLCGPAYRFPGDRSEGEIGARLALAGDRISQHLASLST